MPLVDTFEARVSQIKFVTHDDFWIATVHLYDGSPAFLKLMTDEQVLAFCSECRLAVYDSPVACNPALLREFKDLGAFTFRNVSCPQELLEGFELTAL